jgi:hypothetical protein
MSLPLYGFLEGDTIGVLIVSEENGTVASLARKLQDAASIRVTPHNRTHVVYRGKVIDPALTLAEAGFTELERFDVREEPAHGLPEDR